tara:strand:- start:4549 stop:7314 length:2766 start_codon:yes stop_codon:yes gene_type:complete
MNRQNQNENLSKVYSPLDTESKWQDIWNKEKAFQADPNSDGEPFSVVIPPPNVTGSLHMGHAFNTALIDVVVRYKRLIGKNVLCLPGTDHASIAVQTILERKIKKDNLTLVDIGRESFLKRAWEWKEESGGTIVSQLKKLGFSVDWSRERFTLDDQLNKAVIEAFILLHEEGLIYRGEYLVNWCPASQSAVSDLEVEMKEVDGSLWNFMYPIVDPSDSESQYITVATTRPETMLGDAAIAVNPDDKRYQELIGKFVELPFLNRKIPIIADNYVDQDFGTGCVKITPAHDPNDFAMGQRHNLPQISIMNPDGTLNKNAGQFAGLDRFVARKAIVKGLQEKGLLAKTEQYRHKVPFSDRGKVPVEPLLSTQWFVKMNGIADQCLEASKHGEPNFFPNRWKKVYDDWLEDLQDWCISRQLWWGHQIPVWYIIKDQNQLVNEKTPYVVARNEKEAYEKAKENCVDNFILKRDEDVLDTWFSSGLWPFSTLGWPDKTNPDYNLWYPTGTLITGFDIIFFWVARMTMMASFLTKQLPFKDVYIHGLVRDEQNKKMSKSAGNGIDPLLLIQKYGSDALRFALVREVMGAGQDIRLDYDREKDTSSTVESSRNFANKLWNATRFALLNLSDLAKQNINDMEKEHLRESDKWILSRLNRVIKQTQDRYESYKLGEAAKGLYEFTWNDLCDNYLELIKPRLQNNKADNHLDNIIAQKVLFKVLNDLFIMINPLMPHLTEELWHGLTNQSEKILLSKAVWPVSETFLLNDDLEESFEKVFNLVRITRNLRAEAGVKPSQKLLIYLLTDNKDLLKVLHSTINDIKYLTRSSDVQLLDSHSSGNFDTSQSLIGVTGDLEVVLPLKGVVDVDDLRCRLNNDLEKAQKEFDSLSTRISNKNFVEKAPQNIVHKCRDELDQVSIQVDLIKSRLNSLK